MAERHMSNRERALALVRARGIARARDFTAAGIPLAYLKRMTDAGVLERLERGLYQDPERVGEDIEHNYAEAVRRAPVGVISLLSALKHHDLTAPSGRPARRSWTARASTMRGSRTPAGR